MNKLLIALAFCASLSFAFEIDFTGRAYEPRDALLIPLRAGTAISTKGDTTHPTTNGAILRKRNSEGLYNLFVGRVQPARRNKMSLFLPKNQDAWKLLLTAQFYPQATPVDSEEIPEVLWENNLLLVEASIDTLYALTTQGVLALPATDITPISIHVETDPRSATLTINGQVLGATPSTQQWLGGRWIRVRLDKLGYLSWEDVVEADAQGKVDLSVQLQERPYFQNGTPADTSGIDAHGSKDIHVVADLLTRITTNQLNREGQDAAQWLSVYLDTLRNRSYTQYLPPENLTLEAWDSTQGGLPVRFWYGDEGFDFGFTGVIPCNLEESFALADLFKATEKSGTLKDSERSRRLSWPSAHLTARLDGFVRLRYRNWSTEARSNSRTVQRYLALDGLDLVLPNRTITLSGSFTQAGYLKGAAATLKDSSALH